MAVLGRFAFPEHGIEIGKGPDGRGFDTPKPRVFGALLLKCHLELVDDRFETFDDGDRI